MTKSRMGFHYQSFPFRYHQRFAGLQRWIPWQPLTSSFRRSLFRTTFCMKSYFRLPCNCVYISGHLLPPGAVQFASEVLFSLLPSAPPCNWTLPGRSERAGQREGSPRRGYPSQLKATRASAFLQRLSRGGGKGIQKPCPKSTEPPAGFHPTRRIRVALQELARVFPCWVVGRKGEIIGWVLCVLLLVLVGFCLLVFKWGWR